MSRSAFPAFGVGLALSFLAACAALDGCAAAGSNPDLGRPAEAGDTSGDNAGSGAVSSEEGGAPETSGSGGKGGAPPIDVDPSSSAGMPDETCAADVTTAQVLPLDLYIMLDSSASMLDPLLTNSTKWSSVKSGIRTFLRDKPSAGFGVGLQYFPIAKQNVPPVCAKDADCGDAAPCLVVGLCYADLDVFGRIDCVSNDQCFLGPCVVPGACAKNANYICPTVGASCGQDAAGGDLGLCTAAPPNGFCTETSVCDATQYATPAEPIATLPDAADALIASLDAHVPGGNTPTGQRSPARSNKRKHTPRHTPITA